MNLISEIIVLREVYYLISNNDLVVPQENNKKFINRKKLTKKKQQQNAIIPCVLEALLADRGCFVFLRNAMFFFWLRTQHSGQF